MALIKTYTTPQGVDATYHKIIKVEYSIVDSFMTIVVAVFVSEAARDANASPLWHEYVRVPFSDFAVDPRTTFYAVLQNYVDSYLKGAVRDVRPDPEPVVETTEEVEDVIDDAAVPGDANYRGPSASEAE